MQSVLEDQRKAHEELECIEDALVSEFLLDPRTHRDRLFHDHRLNDLLTRLGERSVKLQDAYLDTYGSRATEINAITGAPKAEEAFPEFYTRLRDIKDHYRKHPEHIPELPGADLLLDAAGRANGTATIEGTFTGEEANGRFLDLHLLHDRYINLRGIKRIDYLHYLDVFDHFDLIPQKEKNASYQSYLQELKVYLEGFLHRTRPLQDLEELRLEAASDFADVWAEGKAPGWEGEMEARLDQESMDPSLFCSACKKQYSKQTVYDAHLSSKKHIKAEANMKVASENAPVSTPGKAQQEIVRAEGRRRRDLAFEEALIRKLAESLLPQREGSKANVERKQVLTEAERAAEIEEMEKALLPSHDGEEDGDEEEDEDDMMDGGVYNPLKLPLGWDGKPIPYWLYRLHGLSVEYPCEVCGGHIYRGRKVYEAHFSESRHTHGLRCLGISNSRTYHDIPSIADAKALAEKKRKEARKEGQMEDAAEEYEDAAGNVFSRKTYEDLKRQGLL